MGNVSLVSVEGNNWSSSVTSSYYLILRFSSAYIDNGGGCNFLSIGFPVRCVRE